MTVHRIYQLQERFLYELEGIFPPTNRGVTRSYGIDICYKQQLVYLDVEIFGSVVWGCVCCWV